MDTFDIHGFIILLFCMIDECTGELEQHGNAKLHPSEIVTLALLKRMSGKAYRRFLVWLRVTGLFPRLPDYTRLCRLFHQYEEVIDVFSRQLGSLPVDWAVLDSVHCEVIHPIREGRKTKWVGKNKSKGRWVVGMKVIAVVTPGGDILDWTLDTSNIHDTHFAWIVERFDVKVLSDTGFHSKNGDPENLKICKRGEQNERMVVESVFSLLKRLLGLNQIQAKSRAGFELTISSIFALFNLLLEMNRRLGLYTNKPAIAHFFCL
jgi:hypothetical protein